MKTAKLRPCLGGFCSSREHCAHYHSDSDHPPAERLCYAIEHPAPFAVKQRTIGETTITDWNTAGTPYAA